MKKENELHLSCSCHSHELHIEKDHEDDMWYISFWQRGYTTETTWRYRLKCIWYILNELIRDNLLNNDNISDILLKTYIFFQYYNNNYRPIYHLENYMYNLITIINGYKTCT